MSGAYLHLVLNHFPIIGTFIFAIILGIGLLKKAEVLTRTGLLGLLVMALISIPVLFSGEEAEELVEEKLPQISHQLIHKHEESAETAFWLTQVMGIMSFLALYFRWKKHPLKSLLSYLSLLSSIISFTLMGYAGKTGGEIRHTEILEFNTPNDSNEFENEEKEEPHDDDEDAF